MDHRFVILLMCASCAARSALLAPEEEDASVVVDAEVDHFVHDAGVDHDIPDVLPDVPTSPLCTIADAGFPSTLCAKTLVAGKIVPSSVTCFVDTVVKTGAYGSLSYACMSDPSTWAGASFVPGAFAGAIDGTTVDLCTGTTFPYADGCLWASAQRIHGDIASGALTFTYEEQPIQGSHCASPCSAQGTLEVQ
jgi:hypothetical protein